MEPFLVFGELNWGCLDNQQSPDSPSASDFRVLCLMSKKNEKHGKKVNRADTASKRKSDNDLRAGGVPRKGHRHAAFPGDLYGSHTETWVETEESLLKLVIF